MSSQRNRWRRRHQADAQGDEHGHGHAHAATSQTSDGIMLPDCWPCRLAATNTGTDATTSSGGTHSARHPSARLPAEYAADRPTEPAA